jgi:hypothetical protein
VRQIIGRRWIFYCCGSATNNKKDKAACPEQTKANEKYDKLRSVTEYPKGIALILCDLKKINHRIKWLQWFGVSFCIGFTFASDRFTCV